MRYLRSISPWIMDVVARSRAQRERDYHDFIKRRDAAIARKAVEDPGVGE